MEIGILYFSHRYCWMDLYGVRSFAVRTGLGSMESALAICVCLSFCL